MVDVLSRNSEKLLALVIDDEVSICTALAGVLSDEGWNSISAHSGKEGFGKLQKTQPDVVFLDVWMQGWDGIETLQKIKDLRSDLPVVIMSGHATIDTAVRATKLGAYEFLEKPLSLDKIIPLLNQIKDFKFRRESQQSEVQSLSAQIIGQSTAIDQIRRQLTVVAPKNVWVLITGENGTGKEIVARNLHTLSIRSTKPFIAINCAAIPEELIESELFGYTKGAFTNALASKKGKFELAHEGTLFLDEIADMSLKTQAKILRILQEQQFERLGDNHTVQVDVRVIAATNKDLEEEIAAGRFREDLFYRLNVIPFHLPPLRERDADVLGLAEEFLIRSSAQMGITKKQLSEGVKQAFLKYQWPGNIRELKNLIERLCILAPGNFIELSDLPASLLKNQKSSSDNSNQQAVSPSMDSLRQARNDFERTYILDKLREYNWNVSKTAEAIGIERSNLHRKLKSYDIDPKLLKEDK